MNKPFFSIITICYNSEKTLERTIQHVLSQTYKDYEYIIVDGGSQDNTLDIIRKYEPQFEGRLKWISELDEGIYDAMNKGILKSVGTIIGIVNSDDWLEDDALSNVFYKYIENDKNQEVIYTGGMLFHYNDCKSQVLMPNITMQKRFAATFQMGGIRHPATFVPKSIYEKYGMFDIDMKISADADFILRCFFGGVSFVPIMQVLTNMSDGGISNSLKSISVSKKVIRDRKIMLSKYEMSYFKRFFFMQYWLFRQYMKAIINKFGKYKLR